MFCPSCGIEERQRSQFCRACGADLRPVRTGLERIDAQTSAAVSAREEIGRAIANKIKDIQRTKDLESLVEGVLPQVEKFLESPEERRLRRIREGVITAAVGMAIMLIVFLLFGIVDEKEVLLFSGLGLVPFLIGLGMALNGLLFSTPSRPKEQLRRAEMNNILDPVSASVPAKQILAAKQPIAPSVTEHTTHHLADEPRVSSE